MITNIAPKPDKVEPHNYPTCATCGVCLFCVDQLGAEHDSSQHTVSKIKESVEEIKNMVEENQPDENN